MNETTINVENLTYTYPGSSNPAIKDLTFEIKKGEIFGFLGPSGAGKSTTQKILNGLLKNFKGEVKILNSDLRTVKSDYFEQIGVCFEMPTHFLKLSALENLKFFGSLYKREKEDYNTLLEMVGLADSANMRVAEFSKGMKTRLSFIRSFLHNPDLIFLDEPTAGLDPVNARTIKDIIQKKKNEGKTIFITTHNMNDAEQLCDRVAFIIDGEIKIIDTPYNLKQRLSNRVVKIEYINSSGHIAKEFSLDSLIDNNEFTSIFQDKSNKILTIHSQEPTLEKVFIEITGRELA